MNKHQAGMDAAAFRGDLDGDSGQLKHESVLQKRSARHPEKSPGDRGGTSIAERNQSRARQPPGSAP